MTSFFTVCALLGGAVLLLQLALGLFGLDGDGHVEAGGHEALHGGLDLLSVRALAAGVAGFGFGGLIGMSSPFGVVGGLLLGMLLGTGSALAVAYIMRSMLRLEADGTLRLENAIGASAKVHLTVPASRSGTGKIHVTVQGRLVELSAVTAHAAPLSTGSAVVVLDVSEGDVVEVAPEAAILPTEVTHVAR